MILLPLPYDVEKGIYDLIGLIMDEDECKVRYHAKFSTTTNTAVYDTDIPNNATTAVRAKAEVIHTDKIADCQLFSAADVIPNILYLRS